MIQTQYLLNLKKRDSENNLFKNKFNINT